MNMALYKQMLKVNYRTFLSYSFGSAFYILLMFWIFPSISDNSASINELIQSMPAGVGKMFGIESGFGTIESFISGEYYGLLFLILLSIFCVLIATQLVAKLVDQGSMAYLLSTPTTRGKVVLTQACVLLTGLVIIMVVTVLSGFAGYVWFIGNLEDFNATGFIRLNVAAWLLFFALGGIAFLVSCICSDEKRALGISGILIFVFFSLNLVGKMSDKLEWMRNISLFSLFDPSSIVSGQTDWLRVTVLLLGIGLVSFIAGIMIFRKRSLLL